MIHRRRRLIGSAAFTLGLLVSSCGNDITLNEPTTTTGGRRPTTGSSTTRPATTQPTTTVAPTTVTAPRIFTVPQSTAPTTARTPPSSGPNPPDTLDWDGVRYDFGHITDLRSDDNGDVLSFDRYQLYGEDGNLLSGADFTEEPVVFGNGDVPWVNENPAVRDYRLHPEAEVLTLVNPGSVGCVGVPVEEPEWQSSTAGDLLASGPPSSHQVSLVFNDDGLLTLVRVSEGC